MRRLLGYLAPHRGAVAGAMVLLLAHSILTAIGPLLTKTAIDRYLAPVPGAAPWLPEQAGRGLWMIGVLYFTAIVVQLLCDFGQQYLTQRTGQFAMFGLRRDLMARLQQLDVSYFDHNPVGRLVTRVTGDVDTLNEMFSSGIVTVLGDLCMLGFVMAAMFWLSPGLTLVLLAIMPLVILATAMFRRAVQLSYRRIRVAVAKINAFLQEHVNGIAVLQLFNREAKARAEFAAINSEHMNAFKDSVFAYGWFYPVVEFLSMLALAALLAYGGFLVREGERSLGVLIAFLQYGLRFFRPIQDLSEKYNIMQAAVAAGERIFKLLDTTPGIVAPATPRGFPDGPAAIEFDNVSFAYRDEEWVLREVSFRIEPGETIAIVGHTGAGKTTLTNLLLRYYDVQQGAVRVGGADVREFDPRELRAQFGVVLQDPFLFTGTLEENIAFGAEVKREQLERAVEQVNLAGYVATLPGGLSHAVRERGQGLSTGQKQLVSFARALARNPRFLILDEATSSVDTETELRIREALDRLITDRTSIIIAHRLSTIQRADRIFVMHKGHLREQGTHQELLAARGLYWRLYRLQYKDQEIDAHAPPPIARSGDAADADPAPAVS